MIEWSVFYQLLDIPAGDDPTYYQLLGVEPGACTPEIVQAALERRKQQLRQRIPGPHFLPLVARFEREYLQPAARVLLNPQTRKAYDQRLERQKAQPLTPEVRTARRRQAVKVGYVLVTSACNKDGTLDEEKRPGLAEKLRKLGFSEGDIRVLFQGIPLPGQKLRETCIGPEREDDDLVGLEQTEQAMPEPLDDRFVRVIVGIAVGIAVLAVLMITGIVLYQSRFREPAAQPAPKTETPTTSVPPGRIQTPAEQEPTRSESPMPASPAVQPEADLPVSRFVQDIRLLYSFSDEPVEVLADLALTMMAACERVGYITHRDSPRRGELLQLVRIGNRSQRMEFLVRDVRLALRGELAAPVQTDEDRQRLRRYFDILRADEQPAYVKYHAVEQLRLLDTPAATAILVNMLQGNNVPDLPLVNRILRALREMSEPTISTQLLDILSGTPRKSVIHPIIRTLLAMNGLQNQTPDTCRGVLPYTYDKYRLADCIEWWRVHYDNQAAARIRNTEEEPHLRDNDDLLFRLTACTVFLTTELANACAAWDWDMPEEDDYLPPESGSVRPEYDVFDQWQGALDAFWIQVLRLVRTHPQGRSQADRVDALEARYRLHRLLEDDPYRIVRGQLEDILELMTVLVSLQVPDQSVRDFMTRLRRTRQQSVASRSDVSALRGAGYDLLVLLDLLARQSRVRDWSPDTIRRRGRTSAGKEDGL